jgi:hypothetical protein
MSGYKIDSTIIAETLARWLRDREVHHAASS